MPAGREGVAPFLAQAHHAAHGAHLFQLLCQELHLLPELLELAHVLQRLVACMLRSKTWREWPSSCLSGRHILFNSGSKISRGPPKPLEAQAKPVRHGSCEFCGSNLIRWGLRHFERCQKWALGLRKRLSPTIHQFSAPPAPTALPCRHHRPAKTPREVLKHLLSAWIFRGVTNRSRDVP